MISLGWNRVWSRSNPLRYLVNPLRRRVATGGALQTFLSALKLLHSQNSMVHFKITATSRKLFNPNCHHTKKNGVFSTNYFWAFIMIDHPPVPISPSPLISQWAPRVHQGLKVKRPYFVLITPKADGFTGVLLIAIFCKQCDPVNHVESFIS